MENLDSSVAARSRLAVLSAHLSVSHDHSDAVSPSILERSCVSSQFVPPPPNGALTIIDERTGKKYQVQDSEEGTLKATDLKKITAGPNDNGLKLYDPGYLNTAPVRSSICYIDGDAGILRYRGFPIEELVEGSSFVEVTYLLMYGNLPSESQLADWEFAISQHSAVSQGILDIIQAMPHDAHSMGVPVNAISALSVFHPDANPVLREYVNQTCMVKQGHKGVEVYKLQVNNLVEETRNEHALRKNQPLVLLNIMHQKTPLFSADNITGAEKYEKMCLQTLSICAFPVGLSIQISISDDTEDQVACTSNTKSNSTTMANAPTILDCELAQTVTFFMP